MNRTTVLVVALLMALPSCARDRTIVGKAGNGFIELDEFEGDVGNVKYAYRLAEEKDGFVVLNRNQLTGDFVVVERDAFEKKQAKRSEWILIRHDRDISIDEITLLLKRLESVEGIRVELTKKRDVVAEGSEVALTSDLNVPTTGIRRLDDWQLAQACLQNFSSGHMPAWIMVAVDKYSIGCYSKSERPKSEVRLIVEKSNGAFVVTAVGSAAYDTIERSR